MLLLCVRTVTSNKTTKRHLIIPEFKNEVHLSKEFTFIMLNKAYSKTRVIRPLKIEKTFDLNDKW